MDQHTPPSSATRRQVLHIGARGATLLALSGAASGVLAGLGGCESSKRRGGRPGNMVGQPIPNDPIISSNGPTYRPAPPKTVSGSGLTELPSFVIARSAWTRGKTISKLADPMRKVTRITVHHDAISPLPSGRYDESVRRLATIRRGHLNNHWADIGYHYAVDPAGRVWQARPLVYQGAHVKNHNPGNLGIVVFGNYEKTTPTAQALTALNSLIAHEMQRFRIPLNKVYTHRELRPTACPGKNLQQQMNHIRRRNGALAQIGSRTTHA